MISFKLGYRRISSKKHLTFSYSISNLEKFTFRVITMTKSGWILRVGQLETGQTSETRTWANSSKTKLINLILGSTFEFTSRNQRPRDRLNSKILGNSPRNWRFQISTLRNLQLKSERSSTSNSLWCVAGRFEPRCSPDSCHGASISNHPSEL